MRTFKPALNSKGLLAASVALLSGHALAEDAGRVSFVTGNVTASSPDGSARALHKGDVINGGDKISTGSGRLQIRFTDGGFVSLQPNTVFGIDQYLYANRKPEETSLFFSLLQGGLRTITGAIGKVNKQSYKVRTPVATIGIRGTEYLASVTPTGLIVSVGSGFVNVSNSSGDLTAGAGQNIFVRTSDSTPGLTDEEPSVPAPGTGDNTQGSGSNPATIGNVQGGNGDYIFLFNSPATLKDSDLATGSPSYYMAAPGYSLVTGSGYTGVLATFDQSGATTGSVGTLLKTWLSSPADPAAPDFDASGMQAVDIGTIGNLSWGAYTNGAISNNAMLDSCGDGCTNPITLSSTEFLPYVIGTPAMSNLAHGTATYTLQGGTLPRNQNGVAGTLDSFKISVDLDFATMNVAMQLTMPGTTASNTYSVTTTGGKPVGVMDIGTANSFSLGSNDLAVTDSGGSCGTSGSGSCYATISGFFAGSGASQIGAAYEINNYQSSDTITGAAALGMSGYDPNTHLNSGPGYSAAYTYGNTTGFIGGYNAGTYSDASLNAKFDASGALQSATQYSTSEFDRGTGALADGTGSVGALKWGRWYSTSVNGDNITTPESSTTVLGSGSYLHYIVGAMTEPNIFTGIANLYPGGATATYTYQGGTTATGSDGTTGTVASGSTLTVSFGTAPTLAVDLGINMSNNTGSIGNYQVNGSGIAVNTQGSATFSASTLSVSGTACASSGACSANIQGFFAGQQAQQIGMGYQIKDSVAGRDVNGAAAFGRGDITPVTRVP